MKMRLLPLLAAALLSAGCLVRSVQPWLSEETRVSEPSLLGTWRNTQGDSVAFFSGTPEEYMVLSVDDGKSVSRFVATLHRLDDVLLLQVGPAEPENMSGYALLPAYILFKAVLKGNSLKLYEIDVDSFAQRVEKMPVPLLAGGSKDEGFVLTGTAEESTAFLRAHLGERRFFSAKPLYSFRKLPATTE